MECGLGWYGGGENSEEGEMQVSRFLFVFDLSKVATQKQKKLPKHSLKWTIFVYIFEAK